MSVRLGAPATAAELDGFDDVVIACGSEEVLPALPGIERALGASSAIRAGATAIVPGSDVLIVDDGFGSWLCASAVELAVQAGARRITVLTPGAAFGASLPPEGRVQLLARLRGAPVEVRPLSALDALTDGAAQLRNTLSGQTDVLVVDTVIVVGERRARDWHSLVPANSNVRVIGDALVPRRVAHAISEGRAAAEAISQARLRDTVRASA
jgi:hypothetical protein